MAGFIETIGGQPLPGGIGTVRPSGPTAGIRVADDADLDVVGSLTRPVVASHPRPRYNTIDRPGAAGLVEFAGMDPYEMTMPLRFDGFRGSTPQSVEPQMALLEFLAERQPDTLEPPIIRVHGRGVPHQNLRWRVQELRVDDTLTLVLPSGDRCRIMVEVDLIQHVADDLLVRSLKATKRAKGIPTHLTRARSGEDSLFDVSRRVYGDPSRAVDIARASGLRLGARLKVGQLLRYP